MINLFQKSNHGSHTNRRKHKEHRHGNRKHEMSHKTNEQSHQNVSHNNCSINCSIHNDVYPTIKKLNAIRSKNILNATQMNMSSNEFPFIQDVNKSSEKENISRLVTKRDIAEMSRLLDDAIEFYDEIDQLDEEEEESNRSRECLSTP